MTSHRRALGGRAGADGWLNCDGVRFALPPRLRPDHDLYQHNPVRTPLTDPYSFGPHTVYGFPGPNDRPVWTPYQPPQVTADGAQEPG